MDEYKLIEVDMGTMNPAPGQLCPASYRPQKDEVRCKSCGAKMFFADVNIAKDPAEDNPVIKRIPIIFKDGVWINHFMDCPHADQHRK